MLNNTMKIRELLNEHISVSPYTTVVKQALRDIVIELLDVKRTISPDGNKDALMATLRQYNNAIIPVLMKLAKEISGMDVTVLFHKMPVGKTGSYNEDTNTIYITSSTLGNLASVTVEKARIQKPTAEFYDKMNAVLQGSIRDITTVFLHEITHAIQVSRGQKYEYKHGYIEKDPIKFFTALTIDAYDVEEMERAAKNLFDTKIARDHFVHYMKQTAPERDKRNKEIYLSQPDEIAAYAQQIATEFIQTIRDKSVFVRKRAIDAFLKALSKSSNVNQYSAFRDNLDPRYQMVYRRYLKLIYQELMRYREATIS